MAYDSDDLDTLLAGGVFEFHNTLPAGWVGPRAPVPAPIRAASMARSFVGSAVVATATGYAVLMPGMAHLRGGQ